jgi:hypothetical protein
MKTGYAMSNRDTYEEKNTENKERREKETTKDGGGWEENFIHGPHVIVTMEAFGSIRLGRSPLKGNCTSGSHSSASASPAAEPSGSAHLHHSLFTLTESAIYAGSRKGRARRLVRPSTYPLLPPHDVGHWSDPVPCTFASPGRGADGRVGRRDRVCWPRCVPSSSCSLPRVGS